MNKKPRNIKKFTASLALPKSSYLSTIIKYLKMKINYVLFHKMKRNRNMQIVIYDSGEIKK